MNQIIAYNKTFLFEYIFLLIANSPESNKTQFLQLQLLFHLLGSVYIKLYSTCICCYAPNHSCDSFLLRPLRTASFFNKTLSPTSKFELPVRLSCIFRFDLLLY